MKKVLRFLAASLAVILLFSLLPHGVPVSARTTGPFSGSGTADDPFLISTTEELYALAALVNAGHDCAGKSFLLTADITLNDTSDFADWSETSAPANVWQPIGNGYTLESGETALFRGSFSGGGHEIGGMYVFASAGITGAGLFGNTEGGAISGLELVNSLVCGEADRVGGIVGKAAGTSLSELSFSGRVRGRNAVGGVAGEVSDAACTDCSAEAAVTGVRSTGGVAGGCARVRFESCISSGSAVGENYVGGIVGIAEETELVSCENAASVSSPERIGGVVGFCYDCTLSGCVNRGAISGGDHLGGVAGLALTSELTGVENLGRVSGSRFVGGTVGMISGCTLTESANRGPVGGEDYIGGLIGWSDDGADFGQNGLINGISRCMNTGAVLGEWGVGGLIGDAHNADIADCFNIGAVDSSEYAGGLIGYTADCTVSRCYNTGTVSAETAAGGIVGRNSMDRTTFESCFYLVSCCAAGDEYGTARDGYELLDEASYASFDFETVWEIAEGGYPFARLRTERLAPPTRLWGDLDGSGETTVVDAVLALRISMGILETTPLELFGGDADESGTLDVADALIILRISMGLL